MGRRARDLDALTPERAKLAAAFHGRALAIAASLGRRLPSFAHDDLRSAAGWGCVFAASVWDEAKGPWEPHAYHVVRAKVRDALRSVLRRLDRHLGWTHESEPSAVWWW